MKRWLPPARKAGKRLAHKPGDIVEHGDGHHQQQQRNAAALQALHPGVGDCLAGHALPKIIHQVPTIEDRQGQQVQLPHSQLRHRELTGGPQPGLCRHLAQAVGSPVGAIATLRAAATPHWAQLPKGRQKTRFQIPNEKMPVSS